jgi:hypothetical protein
MFKINNGNFNHLSSFESYSKSIQVFRRVETFIFVIKVQILRRKNEMNEFLGSIL